MQVPSVTLNYVTHRRTHAQTDGQVGFLSCCLSYKSIILTLVHSVAGGPVVVVNELAFINELHFIKCILSLRISPEFLPAGLYNPEPTTI